MTLMIVCAIKDTAVDAFNRPMYAPSIPAMVRNFTDEVNRKDRDNPLNAHPEDFILYSLGTWEDTTGAFQQDQRVIVRAKDVFKE